MPELLTKPEAAELMRVSPRTLDRLVRAGRLEAVKVSARRVAFSRRTIERYLQARTVTAARA